MPLFLLLDEENVLVSLVQAETVEETKTAFTSALASTESMYELNEASQFITEQEIYNPTALDESLMYQYTITTDYNLLYVYCVVPNNCRVPRLVS